MMHKQPSKKQEARSKQQNGAFDVKSKENQHPTHFTLQKRALYHKAPINDHS